MECFICGKETDKIFRIEVEGNLVEVCEKCKSYGRVVSVESFRKDTKKRTNKNLRIEEEELELIENYGEVIRNRREELGLSIQELAKRLRIKESLLSKIEKGEIYPEEKIVEIIEKTLKIKIREEVKDNKIKSGVKEEKLTIADVVELK